MVKCVVLAWFHLFCVYLCLIYIRQKELIVLIYYTISFEHSFGDGWLANHQTNSQWEEGWLQLIGSWRGPHRLHVYWYKHPVPLIEVIYIARRGRHYYVFSHSRSRGVRRAMPCIVICNCFYLLWFIYMYIKIYVYCM